MSSSLHSRFASAEYHLLSSFPLGEVALSSFAASWLALVQDFRIAEKLQQVDHQTTLLAQCTASRIHCLTESLFSLHIAAEEVREKFIADIRSSIIDDQFIASPSSWSPPEPSSHTDITPVSFPLAEQGLKPRSLDSTCWDWLLQHLHDPYPSSAVKSALGESCNVSLKDVQNWFADARRRIGWTALSQERFSGSRRDSSAAASRAYSEDGPDNSLPLDLRRAFAAIKANASILCSSQRMSPRSSESQSSSVQVLDSSQTVDDSKERDEDNPVLLSHNSSHDDVPPSPLASSSTASSNSSLADEEDTTPPPPIAGSKRRLDMSVDMQECNESATPFGIRPMKRHRYMSPATDPNALVPSMQTQPQTTRLSTVAHFTAEATLSSPIIAISSSSETSEHKLSVVNAAFVSISLSPRKRRLSDAFAADSPKRPWGLISAPRRQTVSDPLPNVISSAGSEMHTLDEWLQSSFEIPYAAELGGFDSSLPCNVELASFAEHSNEATPSASSVPFVSESRMSDGELILATPEGFDLSAYNSDAMLASSDLAHHSDVATSDGSSASSPSSASSYSDLSDYRLPDNTLNVDWTQDWSQFLNNFDSLGSLPPSSQSSTSDLSPSCPTAADSTSIPSPDDITHTVFAMDSSFSSDLLSDIGEFSSLYMPSQTFF